jgi:hypothetical protein
MISGVKAVLRSASLAVVLALVAAGCGGSTSPKATTTTSSLAAYLAGFSPPVPMKATCSYRAGWQKLANRIAADVYCPGWLPDPLIPQIGSQNNNINVVSKDRSYLESFIWQDTDTPNLSGELHFVLQGFPGRTKIPTCLGGTNFNTPMPCFQSPHGQITENGIRTTLYTVNLDVDTWHLLLLWHHDGGIYALSEHLAPPLDYKHVVVYLKLELRSLVLIAPNRST